MFCPKCGTQNPDTGKFCRSCGTDIGNVTEALSGKLPKTQAAAGKKGEPVTLESALTKLFMGAAFLIIAIVLAFTNMGRNWWFWMLIPAFGLLGTGLAHFFQLRQAERRQGVSFVSAETPSALSSPTAPPKAVLTPTQTDYVEPAAARSPGSVYETGELVAPPAAAAAAPSVTEDTTRHLEINHEGETMTLPKRR